MQTKVSYENQPCDRCGSKKIVTKTRKVTTATLIGSSKIEYSIIICTNKECQREFESKLLEKTQKEEAMRLKREENKAARKIQA